MSQCHCQYTGQLSTQEHRQHHRQWEQQQTSLPISATATTIEITDIYQTLDQIIAALHGGPPPALTPGAQAIINKHRSTK